VASRATRAFYNRMLRKSRQLISFVQFAYQSNDYGQWSQATAHTPDTESLSRRLPSIARPLLLRPSKVLGLRLSLEDMWRNVTFGECLS
jgi:hypothetical protein